MSNKGCAIPVSSDILELVRQKQIELITKKQKTLTLTEVSNEIVRKGLESIKNEEEKEKNKINKGV